MRESERDRESEREKREERERKRENMLRKRKVGQWQEKEERNIGRKSE